MKTISDVSAGRRSFEWPFHASLTLVDPDDVSRRLGLPSAASIAHRAMRASLVANALYAAWRNRSHWRFYARDRNHYAQYRGYWSGNYTYVAVTESVDELAATGYLTHDKTPPSSGAKYRSRFRATEVLMAATGMIRADAFRCMAGPSIIVRDDVRAARRSSSRAMHRLCADVDDHNHFLDQFAISVVDDRVRIDDYGFILIRQQRINPYIRSYYRVFNGTWSKGGRWYGPWWQALPSGVRAGIRIDEEATVEEDFPACHLRLLSAAVGVKRVTTDGRDPYANVNLPRDIAKLTVNILLNSANENQALGALTQHIGSHHSRCDLPSADYVFAEIKSAFPHLRKFWLTGAGLRLQTVDSTICANVQRSLRKEGIPCLSIHDSFITPRNAKEVLVTVMEREFEGACRRISLSSFFAHKSAC